VKRRVVAAYAVLLVLFLAVVPVQLFVSDRLQADQLRHSTRLARALDANSAVLQHMTDAETGVRGFQLTGAPTFLGPYDSGRFGAFAAFEEITGATRSATVRQLVAAERAAADQWMDAYAAPIVNAGVADRDGVRTVRGKEMFDRIRAANADVDAALRAERDAVAAADRSRIRFAQLLFAGLAMAFLLVGLTLAAVHQRHLLAPLEHIRHTLRRLAGGEHSVRAVVAGPGEMRAVISSLNTLAAQTERLLEAEQARSMRHELRQAVAAELRHTREPRVTAERVAELIGTALGADAVHGRVPIPERAALQVRWPADAPPLSPHTVADIEAGKPGVVLTVPDQPGAVAVPLTGEAGSTSGLIHVVRHAGPGWTVDDCRLLTALAREIDHTVRQRLLAYRQARLISELRELDERKDAFVATVTHELRTPLTSILGYTEMLADGDGGDLSPLQQRGVGAILRNALRLQETVADLLLLDRATQRAGASYLPVDLAAVMAGVCAELEPAARAREVTVDGAGSGWVVGDAEHLARALHNLVDNAIKFSAAGGRVTWRVIAQDGDAVVTVADTGIGIPPDDLSGLFTPFHRGANAMDQAVQGSGLGLAVTRNIVIDHGGAVAVASQLGRGSTFTVTLPAVTPTEIPPGGEVLADAR
jgi:signal transduction histidine kinase